MKPINFSHPHSFYQQVIYAQQKLKRTDIPLSLKATSYVRICCNAMRKSPRLELVANRSKSSPWDSRTPYLNLLGRLSREVPDWWTTCYVTRDGLLQSRHPKIRQLLQPLNGFVKSIHAPLAA